MTTIVVPADVVFSYEIILRRGDYGFEYIANNDIPAGTIILREKPFFRSKLDCEEMFRPDYRFDLDVANKLMDLVPRGHAKIKLTKSRLKSYSKILLEKYLMNRFESHNPDEAQVLYYGSFFNHSCARNVDPYHDSEATSFVTIRDIKAGEKLTIAYTSPYQKCEIRQHVLKLHYNFICSCEKCITENNEN